MSTERTEADIIASTARKKVVESFSAEDSQRELERIYGDSFTPSPAYQSRINKYINEIINVYTIDPDTRPYQLVRELLLMNDPSIWTNLITTNLSTGKLTQTDLQTAFSGIPAGAALQDYGTSLSMANLPFFGRTLIYFGLAAISGESYSAVIHESTKKNVTFQSETVDNPRYIAGLAAANSFGTVAFDPNEVITRLQLLFPPDGLIREIPAVSFLNKPQAFRNPLSETGAGKVVCPAKNTTSYVFAGYGNLLRNPHYQQRLIRVLS